MFRRLVPVALAAALLTACAPLAPSLAPELSAAAPGAVAPPLIGRVRLPGRRLQLALPEAIAQKATVALIRVSDDLPIASGLADADGRFTITFPADFDPAATPTAVYHLEAVKGLENNQPGHPAVRLRTLVHFDGGAWASFSGSEAIIDAASTGLAVGAALRSATLDPVTLMGAYDPDTGLYSPVSGLDREDFMRLRSLVETSVLVYAEDPIGRIGLVDERFERVEPARPEMELGAFGDAFPADVTPTFAARSNHATVAVGHWVYVVGGNTGSGPTSDLLRATVRPDGSLGDFEDAYAAPTTERFLARSSHTVAVHGDHLYVIGGASASDNHLRSIQRAPIGADGTIGDFEDAYADGATKMTDVHSHASVVVNGALYVTGGQGSGGTRLDAVQRAAFDADGKLGSFATAYADAGTDRITARSSHAAEVVGNRLYVIAGAGAGESMLNSIQVATIGADGTLGDFSSAYASGSTKISSRSSAATLVVGDQLFVLGGQKDGDRLVSLARATIGADGLLGDFSQAYGDSAHKILPRSSHTVARVGNQLYVIGGLDGAGDRTPSVQRASLNFGLPPG